MKLLTRYGLVGIGALGALSLVHWGRTLQYEAPEIVLYLLGVLPNVAAAIATCLRLGRPTARPESSTYSSTSTLAMEDHARR